MFNIGVIGLGYVGKAVFQGYENFGFSNIQTFDINGQGNNNSLEEIIDKDIKHIFICLPTPTLEDGSQPIGTIKETITKIYEKNKLVNIIIKSTITPSNLKELSEIGEDCRLLYNPEFFTQRTNVEDFLNPTRIILGSNNTDVLKSVYEDLIAQYYECKVHTMSLEAASKCKYTSNVFGFVKVMFFNMVREWCETQEEYDILRETVMDSGWVAEMHTMVPGPDGKLGAGGACLPKDSLALLKEMKDNGFGNHEFLNEAIKYNKIIRNK